MMITRFLQLINDSVDFSAKTCKALAVGFQFLLIRLEHIRQSIFGVAVVSNRVLQLPRLNGINVGRICCNSTALCSHFVSSPPKVAKHAGHRRSRLCIGICETVLYKSSNLVNLTASRQTQTFQSLCWLGSKNGELYAREQLMSESQVGVMLFDPLLFPGRDANRKLPAYVVVGDVDAAQRGAGAQQRLIVLDEARERRRNDVERSWLKQGQTHRRDRRHDQPRNDERIRARFPHACNLHSRAAAVEWPVLAGRAA